MIKIRPRAMSDLNALREIYLESRKNAFDWMDSTEFSLEDFDRDTEGELIWVALRDDKPVGFISVWAPENFIHNLFIHPSALRQGIGSALLSVCLNNIGRPATLKCLIQNADARAFYLSKGWEIASEDDGPDGEYHLMYFTAAS
ncbi:MAG: GNAT family N-acetyltransferase [Gammaproteobacteria bacterium]